MTLALLLYLCACHPTFHTVPGNAVRDVAGRVRP